MTRPAAPVHRETGSTTAFTLVLVLAVIAFAGLVLDGGLAVSAKVQSISTAQSAARAGADQLDLQALRATGQLRLDPARAQATARDWLARAGATGTVTATTDTVTVTVTARSRTQLLHLIGVVDIPVTGTAAAQAVHP
jgi:hypothetical protein